MLRKKVLIGTYNYTVQFWVTGGNKYNVSSITLPSLLLLAENHSLFLFNHLHLENSKEHGNFAQLGNFSAQVYKLLGQQYLIVSFHWIVLLFSIQNITFLYSVTKGLLPYSFSCYVQRCVLWHLFFFLIFSTKSQTCVKLWWWNTVLFIGSEVQVIHDSAGNEWALFRYYQCMREPIVQ